MRLAGLLLVASTLLAAGCGPDCQSTCEQLYNDGPGQCNINYAGEPGAAGADALIGDCVTECDAAMARPGDMGDYDPNVRAGSDQAITLDNEKQAAAWMDCVMNTSCGNIEDGYCPPH